MNQTDTQTEPHEETNKITFCTLDDETQDFFDGIYQSPYIKHDWKSFSLKAAIDSGII